MRAFPPVPTDPFAPQNYPFALVQPELCGVEKRLQAGLSSRSARMAQAVRAALASQGKRIRPAILLLAAKLCGYAAGQRHIELATAAEYMHTATLIHDDIIDQADTRRGLPAAHAQWGTQTAVLVGDFLYARAIQALVADGDLAVLETFSKATVSLSEGEVLELEMAHHLDLTYAEYLVIVTCKTAALIAAASRAGGLIAAAPPAHLEALTDYGCNLGRGFQLVDDALDYTGANAQLGKPVGQDVQEGKVTLPLIHVMQHAAPTVQQRLRQLFTQPCRSPREVEEITQLVQQHHGIAATMTQAQDFLQRAQASLRPFPDVPAKQALLALAELVGNRTQ